MNSENKKKLCFWTLVIIFSYLNSFFDPGAVELENYELKSKNIIFSFHIPAPGVDHEGNKIVSSPTMSQIQPTGQEVNL